MSWKVSDSGKYVIFGLILINYFICMYICMYMFFILLCKKYLKLLDSISYIYIIYNIMGKMIKIYV